ncbi:MAG TPA: hypothetical protein VG389_01190 [Myxococcota bacterium]|nr:hypothetical protein [Myxococcota bacterium]
MASAPLTIDVEIDARAVQPADLVSGWVLVHGAGSASHRAALVGLFGKDVDGAVFQQTFPVPLGRRPGSEAPAARFVLPLPPEAATASADEALCLLLCRLATADGEVAAERVEPIEVQAPSAARAAALRGYAAALGDVDERPAQALAAVETAAAALPGYAPAHALLGDLVYAVRGDEPAARRAWEAARHAHPLKLDAGFADYRLALHVAAAGDLLRARTLLEAAAAAAPAQGDYLEALAALHLRAGRAAEAEQALERALALRETAGTLRGLLNLYDAAGRDDALLALGERFFEALVDEARGDAAAGAELLRRHCEYLYLLGRAAARKGFMGAARRWVARYFDHFDAGDRAHGTFAGSPFAQHGDEPWFVEAALKAGHRREDDPYSALEESVARRRREADSAAARAAAAAGAPEPVPGYKVLPSGLILGPRYFEPRDAAALRARWGTPAPAAAASPAGPAAPAVPGAPAAALPLEGPTPVLSRRGAEHWDNPIFDPAFSPGRGAGESARGEDDGAGQGGGGDRDGRKGGRGGGEGEGG